MVPLEAQADRLTSIPKRTAFRARDYYRTAILSIATFTLTEVRRGKLFWLLVFLLTSGIALAEFAGAMAITESNSTKTLLLGSFLRAGAVFSTALCVAASMLREWQDRSVQTLLALPLPRAAFYLGKCLGFGYVVAWITTVCSLALGLYVPPATIGLWAASLFLELNVVAAATMALATVYRALPIVMFGALAFYLLARAMGDFQLLAHSALIGTASPGHNLAQLTVDALAYVLPNLYQFTLSGWLAYPNSAASPLLLGPIFVQTLIYSALCTAVGMFELYRQEL